MTHVPESVDSNPLYLAARMKASADVDDEATVDESPPVHGVWVGDVRATVDLAAGVAFGQSLELGVLGQASAAEARLLLLDWTRRLMPVPSPAALWVVEAAALAAGSALPWRAWATAGLHAALVSLLGARTLRLSSAVRRLLVEAVETAAVSPTEVSARSLEALMEELEAAVSARWAGEVDTSPAAPTLPACSEVVWDEVLPVGVDLGELGLRSKVLGTVWTASIASSRLGESGPLWARLVDDNSGEMLDQVAMRETDGIYAVRGYVPPQARRRPMRIDVMADPDRPTSPRVARAASLVDQRWFRTLFFGRQAARGSLWPLWDQEYQARLSSRAASANESWWHPFLAERHVLPTDLASGALGLLSPRHEDQAPRGHDQVVEPEGRKSSV